METKRQGLGQRQPVVGVVGCAAGGVEGLRENLVAPLLDRGYRVTVSLTPTAGWWLSEAGETEKLAALTGLPVRWTSRLPTEPKPHPPADCHAVVPATANSVAKLALGIGDNQALTPVCEAIGDPDTGVVVFPEVSAAHAAHPTWSAHLAALRQGGVDLVHGDHVRPLHPADQEPQRPCPWEAIIAAIERNTPAAGVSQ